MKRRSAMTCILGMSLAVLVFAAGCNKNSNNSNGSSSSSSSTSSSSSSGKSSSGSATSMSPTEVFNAYYDAAIKKDFATAKQYLSKGTLDMMEVGAKAQGKSLDEALKDSPAVSQSDKPQLGAEQINGDTATVDMSGQGQSVKMPFVKENGGWKIAMDKLMADQLGKAGNDHPTEGNSNDENSNH